MNKLKNKIEALLFLEPKALTIKKIASTCEASEVDVEEAVNGMQKEYEERDGGISLVKEGRNVQLMTAPAYSEFIQKFIKEEATGELTRPALETLTIVAYRGPVAKSEIEMIRGINCSLILRNLQIRGMIEQVGENEIGSPIFRVTLEFLRYLGVNKLTDLPEYEELNKNVHLQELLESQKNPDDFFQENEE